MLQFQCSVTLELNTSPFKVSNTPGDPVNKYTQDSSQCDEKPRTLPIQLQLM